MDYLPVLVRYHVSVDERILDQSAKLTDDELRRPGTTDNGSALETLLHMLIVDWSWREFCIGNDDDDSYPDGWPSPTVRRSARSGTGSTRACWRTRPHSTRAR